ncbi:discoidin domain-containing protein [uncultured Muribaculum sp.]|uniref:endo-beta-N-acetylglucosaminidase n=1 Tax=uncultured Muribaculum sp. TaxID=1918613 RepID=UPI0025DF0CBE|nr:discoidin domain-containing protein [uncultured Muribaculum sp.]
MPLKKRIATPEAIKANNEQFAEGQVMVASTTSKMCSQTSSQGFDNFIGYNPTYWQYMEKFVNWGGADNEGVVSFPSPGIIDAAHAQGVKVFATIFLYPGGLGAKWGKEFLTKEADGTFKCADRLYEMAKFYGIDGYFINNEAYSSDEWGNFIEAIDKAAEEAGDDNMEIVWYDASQTPNVKIIKRGARTSHFLDYPGGPGDYSSYAESIGIPEKDIFHRVYGGIECASAGLAGYSYSLDKAFGRTGHVGSVGLFCPEEGTWKANVEKLFFTEDAKGEVAYKAMEKTFENERITWVNRKGDPSKIENQSGLYPWRGISGCVVEASTIDGFPFITSFNVGNGKSRFVEGVNAGSRDWSHPGMQSYLPTWRWWIENGDALRESIDWDDAYDGGNSILISGSLTEGSHLMRLYKSAASCNGGILRLVYKSNNPVAPVLHLSTEMVVNPDIEITAQGISQINGWTVAEYNLFPAKGKTIYMIALDLKADAAISNYEMRLGQLVVIPDGFAPKPVDVANLAIENSLSAEGGDLRVVWDWNDNVDFDHFNIYMIDSGNNRTLVGQTRDEAYYIPEVRRQGSESGVTIEVLPVMKDASTGTPKRVTADYPRQTVPVVEIRRGVSYAKIGMEIVLTAKGTCNPTTCKWILPEGLEFVEGFDGTEFETKVKGDVIGSYTVKALLANEIGTGELEAFAFEVMSEEDYAKIYNVALDKTILEESDPSDWDKAAKYLIDGGKFPYYSWSSTNPHVVIDLIEPYMIYGFAIFDNKSNSRNGLNFWNYRIFLSDDAKVWSEVINETNREKDDIKYDYIAPHKARYVKLVPYARGVITPNIWEFEVYGSEAETIKIDAPAEVAVNNAEETCVRVGYDIIGSLRDENFTYEVKARDEYVHVSDIMDDPDKHEIQFHVISTKDMFGVSSLTVTFDNHGVVRSRDIAVAIERKSAVNVLKGLPAEVRKYDGDYTIGANYTSYVVSTLTDGNTGKDAFEVIEESSMSRYDVWAIVDAGRYINLSKVALHIPENNYGLNANDVEGLVNKEITIKVSVDGQKWKDVRTFSNLDRISELACTLPACLEVRYIAVACDVNMYFYGALAEIEAYEQNERELSSTRPILIKDGFNVDVIAESSVISEVTTDGFDGQGFVFYSSDVKEAGSLPSDGMLVSISGTQYSLGAYDGNNGLKIPKWEGEGNLEFLSPVATEKLYVLIVCADGSREISVTVNYDDGTNSGPISVNTYDWYAEAAYEWNGCAVYGLGRVSRKGAQFDNRYKFMMTESVIDTDKSKNIVSLHFENMTPCQPTIMAVSAVRNSGLSGTFDIINDLDSPKEMVGVYNLQGVRVENPGRGIHIVVYSDGTTKKVLFR